MLRLRLWMLPALTAVFGVGYVVPADGAEPARMLIIDGQNNHDWALMTPPMKRVLEEKGGFKVDVTTTPPAKSSPDAWEAWKASRPKFGNYAVVLSNYNGEPWPKPVESELEEFVAGGGGLVIIHAANNAFPAWGEWNRMIGLGWRDNRFGDRVTVGDDGKTVRTPKGEGPGAGHGPQHEFTIVTRDREHPVMKGLPVEWRHAKDELYHGQRGPAQDMHILATAYSNNKTGGTGAHEPMIWVIPYGKGRVFTTVMGHVGGGDKAAVAIRCVGFQTVMIRGSQWAATGKCDYAVPPNFPTISEVSLANP